MKPYKEAQEILQKINSAKNILLSFHLDADPDSIGSNLGFALVLKGLDKNVLVISPDGVNTQFSYLAGMETVDEKDIRDINQEDFDLYISLDTAAPKMVTHHNNFIFPKDKIIVIDHHKTNSAFGEISLIDGEIGSCSELLYWLCAGWDLKLDKNIATSFMTGIVGDTGAFRYSSGVTPYTFRAASELLALGADYNKICYTIYQNTPLETLKYWGLVLSKLKLEEVNKVKFVYSSTSFEEISKVSKPQFVYGAASVFLQTVKDVDFGLLITEEEKGVLGGSFRGRTDIDVSELASLFEGGGHKVAAGFTVKGYSFEDGEKYILETIKNFLNKSAKK